MRYENVKKTDPAVYDIMRKEWHRQQDGLELIASENFVSESVMDCMGSHLTNKYAEGLPGASSSTKSNSWPSTAPASFSALNTPTFSPTPALRPTPRFTSRCSSPATPSWAWPSTRAAT